MKLSWVIPKSLWPIEKIKSSQVDDAQIVKIIEEVQEGKRPGFNMSNDGVLRFGNRLCVPNDFALKKEIMKKPIVPHTQCTMVALKCIVTFEKLIGGIT